MSGALYVVQLLVMVETEDEARALVAQLDALPVPSTQRVRHLTIVTADRAMVEAVTATVAAGLDVQRMPSRS